VTPPPPGALLRYYAPEVPLPYAHYTQALDPAGTLPPGALQGRLVLLGQNTPVDGVDQFVTPLRALGGLGGLGGGAGGTQSGVFVHATALINGLTGDWVVPTHPLGPILQAALSVAVVAALTRRWQGWRAAWLSVALALLALLGGLWAFLVGVWWSTLPTLAGLALHFNVGAAGSYLRERRRREQLRTEFARYVPPAVVDALVAAGAAPALQGERRVLTLLFSDLAGFTAASEHLPPEAVAQALNAYFSRMTHTVHQHGGTLDKFIGDAVMAFWNAPLPEPDHAARALACAQAMQADMAALRTQWQGTPFADVQLRIGLHTGEAAVGHLGSHERFTYTAVGDAVNTAARLEGASKAFGTGVLVSGATRAALPADDPQRAHLLWLDTVVLAGRSTGLDVYTLCDDAALVTTSLALHHHLQAGEWALALRRCADWQAHAHFLAPQWVAHADLLHARVQAAAQAAANAAAQTPGAPRSRCCRGWWSCPTRRAACNWARRSKVLWSLGGRPSNGYWSTPASGSSGWWLIRETLPGGQSFSGQTLPPRWLQCVPTCWRATGAVRRRSCGRCLHGAKAAPWWTWSWPTWTCLAASSIPPRHGSKAPGSAPKTHARPRAGPTCSWRWTATPRRAHGSTPGAQWRLYRLNCCWPMPTRAAWKARAKPRWPCTGRPWTGPRPIRSKPQPQIP
jgi:class 3 adenylate cyclase